MSIELSKLLLHSYQNREEIEKSSECICFNCLARFCPDEIIYWTDSNDPADKDPGGLREDTEEYKGYTAICPRCENDSVLGSACGVILSEELLKKLKEYWYDKNLDL
jgi:hypothetical protein